MFNSFLKIIREKASFELIKIKNKEPFIFNLEVQSIISQIRENSFAVVPNFYSEQECAILRDEVDRLIEKRKAENNLWIGNSY